MCGSKHNRWLVEYNKLKQKVESWGLSDSKSFVDFKTEGVGISIVVMDFESVGLGGRTFLPSISIASPFIVTTYLCVEDDAKPRHRYREVGQCIVEIIK